MITVIQAAEPEDFENRVRGPGRTFLENLPSLEDVNFTGREYWRKAIPALRNSYNAVCCYTAHWISSDTGASSADHFIARKIDPRLAYEWTNLRYCCSRLNSRKGLRNIIDPFHVVEGMFEIVFPSLFLRSGADFANNDLVHRTIELLGLNDDVVVSAREEYVNQYAGGSHINHLKRHAPLLHHEILRQNLDREALLAMGFGPPAV
ncbi:hypothetical protein [Kumtagia ephedrae]|uniref:hypothetical protein n=1 Tax=Kumtagia ephedrae TaxID=2116701 RepID=UPI001056F54C|nr:hypothetical protein [Mesorhizobium ephedrae]